MKKKALPKVRRRAKPARIETPTRAHARKPLSPPSSPPAVTDAGEFTRSGASLLLVLTDPDTFKCKVDDKCERAGISRATYFRLMKDSDFIRRCRDAQHAALRSFVHQTMGALCASAQLPGKDGHADRKLLLEMTGYYEPSKKLHVTDGNAPRVEGDMPDEELVWWYTELKYPHDRWIPGVLQRFNAGTLQPRKPVAEEIEP